MKYQHLHQIGSDDLLAIMRRNHFSRARTAKELRVSIDALRVRIRSMKQSGYKIPRDPALVQRDPLGDPTPEQITALCWAIKCGWSRTEERSRRGIRAKEFEGYEFPSVVDPKGG